MRLLTVADLAPSDRIVREALAEDAATLHRLARRNAVVERPIWLGPDSGGLFLFDSWRVERRPFDWEVDEGDVPVDPPAPAPYPEQARLSLYLRPPAAVVQR
jgi:hypothetical protein